MELKQAWQDNQREKTYQIFAFLIIDIEIVAHVQRRKLVHTLSIALIAKYTPKKGDLAKKRQKDVHLSSCTEAIQTKSTSRDEVLVVLRIS